jgi:hypothetical protein
VWRYDSTGLWDNAGRPADLGRGQPDALVAPDGRMVIVSTHFRGPDFGLSILRVDSAPSGIATLGTLEIRGAGFTRGGMKPANFPIEAAWLGTDTVLVAFAQGLAVVNVAVPTSPRIESVLDLGGPAVNVDASGRLAAVSVAGPRPRLVLLDFTGTGGPTLRAIPLAPGTLPGGVAFTRSRVAVAAGRQGARLVDRD